MPLASVDCLELKKSVNLWELNRRLFQELKRGNREKNDFSIESNSRLRGSRPDFFGRDVGSGAADRGPAFFRPRNVEVGPQR